LSPCLYFFHLQPSEATGRAGGRLPGSGTSIERKLRMPQIQGVKGSQLCYCEPLTTLEMRCHRLSRRVNKMKI
jgi:hypothetical protein